MIRLICVRSRFDNFPLFTIKNWSKVVNRLSRARLFILPAAAGPALAVCTTVCKIVCTTYSPVLLSCWYKFDRIWQYRYQQGCWYIFIPVTLLVQRSINMTEYSCRVNLSWYLMSISSCHLFFLLVGTIVWPIGSLYINLPTYRDRYINNTLILKIFLKNVLN